MDIDKHHNKIRILQDITLWIIYQKWGFNLDLKQTSLEKKHLRCYLWQMLTSHIKRETFKNLPEEK